MKEFSLTPTGSPLKAMLSLVWWRNSEGIINQFELVRNGLCLRRSRDSYPVNRFFHVDSFRIVEASSESCNSLN